MAPLKFFSGPQANTTDCLLLHIVGNLKIFMGFNIGPKYELAVIFVGKILAIIIFCGEYTYDTPLLDGSWLGQSPINRISPMMIQPGVFLNGKVFSSDLLRSLITRFVRLIYGTFSFVAMVLRLYYSGSESKIN